MEQFVKDAVEKLNLDCESEIYIYKDFYHVGELYLELEDKFDGFAVSGPVPKQAIIKRVGKVKKPLVDFGTDLQSYYETFLKLMYEYNTLDFSRAYLDFMDWGYEGKDISYYLLTGTLGEFMQHVSNVVSSKTLEEIIKMEKIIERKHIRLWNEGKIDFSTTRFSSIVPQLEEAGVNYYFIYPSINLLKDTFDELMKDISIYKMKINQPSVIYITVKEKEEESFDMEELYSLINRYKKKLLADFVIEKSQESIKVFTKLNTVEAITENFTVCPLKDVIETELLVKACVGYGIGNHINEATINAISANKEANSNRDNYSFVVTEDNKLIGPLMNNKVMVVSNNVTTYIKDVSKRVGLSTLTIQKLLSAIDILGTNEISPQELASCLNVTVRTANRFLSALFKYGEAEIVYERQNSTKGRPERVYKIFNNR